MSDELGKLLGVTSQDGKTRRVQVTLYLPTHSALVLGTCAANDGVDTREIVTRAIDRYLCGRIKHPGFLGIVKSLLRSRGML
jgi:hypothetical protein